MEIMDWCDRDPSLYDILYRVSNDGGYVDVFDIYTVREDDINAYSEKSYPPRFIIRFLSEKFGSSEFRSVKYIYTPKKSLTLKEMNEIAEELLFITKLMG